MKRARRVQALVWPASASGLDYGIAGLDVLLTPLRLDFIFTVVWGKMMTKIDGYGIGHCSVAMIKFIGVRTTNKDSYGTGAA